MATNAVDISALQAYCEQHAPELIALAVKNNELFEQMNVIAGVTDKYIMTSLEFDKIFKPYAKDWDPNPGARLTPRTGYVEIGQVELEEEPQAYRKTYLGKLLKGTDPNQHPFEKDFLEGISIRVSNDINDDLAFYGDKALKQSPTPSIAKSVKAINDGFFTIINKEMTAGNISVGKKNLILTGDINSTNAVTKLKAFYRQACKYNPALRRQNVKLYISHDVMDAYNDHYQALNEALPYNTEFEKTFLEGSGKRCELVALSAMGTSKRIMLGPMMNFNILVDQQSDQEKVHVFSPGNPKVIGFYLAAAIGFEFTTLHALWTNEASVDGDDSGSGSASASASGSASASASASVS